MVYFDVLPRSGYGIIETMTVNPSITAERLWYCRKINGLFQCFTAERLRYCKKQESAKTVYRGAVTDKNCYPLNIDLKKGKKHKMISNCRDKSCLVSTKYSY